MSRMLIITAALLLCLARPSFAQSEPANRATNGAPSPAWCAPEVETLPNGEVCHVDGGTHDGRRTLVVFLHGAIAKNTTWQWTQERALARQARQSGFEAIFPQAPLDSAGYHWPGSRKGQEALEQELIDGWAAARLLLEARSGHPFDEVFVMGFSSGAYFVSSLAVRERLDVDGYAVFAGGVAGRAADRHEGHRAPVFVGVCSEDDRTAPDSRTLGASLARLAWPHHIDEERVGHMFSDIHVAHAVSYLRSAARRRRTDPAKSGSIE